MSAARPTLSVVVPTFDSEAVIGGALQSLAAQTFRDFEVVVSDGASRDGTLRQVEAAGPSLPALRVDSRRDQGVYDAINRGVALARGAWFLVLGSDDRLHASDTLAQVAVHLAAAGDAGFVHGDVRMMAPNRLLVPPGGRYAGPMTLSRLMDVNLCQQAIFYPRALFDTLGGFDLRYRIYADWAFNLRAAFRAPPRWMDVVVADYAATGLSADNDDAAFLAEVRELIRREFAQRPRQRDLWPHQRRLLRDADALRRRGDWPGVWRTLGTYLGLRLRRLV